MIIVIGAGPVGTHVARRHVDAGTPVRVLTRSGSGPDHPLVERRRVDAADRAALRDAVAGATVVHCCLHASAYTLSAWERELPAVEAAVLAAAAEVDATVVWPESHYGLDLAHQPTTETSGLTGAGGLRGVRRRLLEARAAAPARTVSVVASDYYGPGAGRAAYAGDRMVAPVVRGRTVWTLGRTDLPHSWTYLPDLAAAMVASADLPPEPDRLLLAPMSEPTSQQEVADAFARAAGRGRATVRSVPSSALRAAGRFHEPTATMGDMVRLMEAPMVLDSRRSERLLGLTPTPWEVAAAETVASFAG